jgi:hypothetical protein
MFFEKLVINNISAEIETSISKGETKTTCIFQGEPGKKFLEAAKTELRERLKGTGWKMGYDPKRRTLILARSRVKSGLRFFLTAETL